MYGYMGKLLFVNLTDGSSEVRDLNEDYARNFVGGGGLGARILYDEMAANTDWDSPDSIIGFVTGPLTGSKALLGSRYIVVSKSPITGGWNDANSGGGFGAALKKTGYDAVFVRGISEKPVYIWIDNGEVEIRDAAELWGLTTTAATEVLREEIGDTKINAALIGPGGENRSFEAGIVNDGHRIAARGGSGAVMGSKNLKALVVRGNKKTEIADPEALAEISQEVMAWLKGPMAGGLFGLGTFGTGGLFVSSALSGDSGIKNWKGVGLLEFPEESAKKIDMSQVHEKYYRRKFTCNACPVGCGGHYQSESEKYPLPKTSRPEYETLGAFGALMLVDDIEAIIMCNQLCLDYGLDSMGIGPTIAWAMECYEEGVISQEELDGIDLKWGDGDAVITLLKKICEDEGCGKWLKNGSQAAADHLGRGHEFLVVASGIEQPQHDGRLSPTLARQYKYDPTPGRHTKGGFGEKQRDQAPDIKYTKQLTGTNEASLISSMEITQAAGMCIMSGAMTPPGTLMKYLTAVTGFKYSPMDAYGLGLRIFHMRNAFNVREGFRRKDYTFSSERFTKGTEEGPLKGVDIDVEFYADNVFNAIGLDNDMMPERCMLELLGGFDYIVEELLGPPPPPAGPPGAS